MDTFTEDEPLARYAEPFTVDETGEIKENLGRLPVIRIDLIPDGQRRNALIMNRLMHDAWKRLDNKNVAHRIAWTALRTRCLTFRMSRDDNARALHLDHSALESLETGKPTIHTVQHILPEWQILAERINEVSVIPEVASARELVSTLFVSDKPESVARLLMRLMYKHGKGKIDIEYDTVRARIRLQKIGNTLENYNAVKTLAALDLSEKEKPELPEKKESIQKTDRTDADFWEHPYMIEYRKAYLEDRRRFLASQKRPYGDREMLCEYLKMLCIPSGHSLSTDGLYSLCEGIGRKNGALLMRNQLIEVSKVHMLLQVLVDQKFITPDVLDEEMKKWQPAVEEQTTKSLPFGRRMHALLLESGLTDSMLASLFDIEGPDKTPLTRERILDARLTDPRVPPYAVACLARGSVADADGDMIDLFRDHGSRAYHRGKTFTPAYRMMAQFGLTAADLPDNVRSATYERYVEDAPEAQGPPDEFYRAARRAGLQKAAKFVRRWIAMHQPSTIQEAALWLPVKEKERTDLAHRAHVYFNTIHSLADGSAVVSLPKMKTIIEAGRALWTDELEIDWYLQFADKQKSDTLLGRAFRVMIGTKGENGAHVFRQAVQAGASLPFNENRYTHYIAAAIKKKKPTDVQFERSLIGGGISIDGPDRVYFDCLRKAKTMHKALDRWVKRMEKADNENLVDALLQLKHYIHQNEAQQKNLHAALKQKQAIKKVIANPDWFRSPAVKRPLQPMLEVLKLLPGLTTEELKTWRASDEKATPEAALPLVVSEMNVDPLIEAGADAPAARGELAKLISESVSIQNVLTDAIVICDEHENELERTTANGQMLIAEIVRILEIERDLQIRFAQSPADEDAFDGLETLHQVMTELEEVCTLKKPEVDEATRGNLETLLQRIQQADEAVLKLILHSSRIAEEMLVSRSIERSDVKSAADAAAEWLAQQFQPDSGAFDLFMRDGLTKVIDEALLKPAPEKKKKKKRKKTGEIGAERDQRDVAETGAPDCDENDEEDSDE